MSRKAKIIKRRVLPDIRYDNELLARFINQIMLDGKKAVAEKIVYDALAEVSGKRGGDSLGVFNEVIDVVGPQVEIKTRRIGGASYPVPQEVRDSRKKSLAMKWLKIGASKRSGMSMSKKLALEIFDAFEGKGFAVKKKEEMHKMAEANKAFAHFKY